MTIWASTDFTGGAIGTQPSTTTEPVFASAGGTAANMTYQAGLSGVTGQTLQTTDARDFVLDTTGRTRWRIGMWIRRVTGTQTAGQACILLRSATTNRADLFLRNQNGGQFALRGASGGTTYAGQTTTTIANGDTWWVELEYNSDGTTHTVTLYLWKPGNTTGTPDDTFTTTAAAAVDNVRLFNPSGPTGLTTQFAGLRVSDGEAIRPADPVAGTVTFLSNTHATDTTITVAGKTAAAAVVRVEATPAGGGTTIVGANTTPIDNYARPTVTGLTADTTYTWALYVDGTSRRTGTITTPPAAGAAQSFTFGWGSCFDTNTSGVFDLIAARTPRFFAMLGDWGYQYLTGGPNGNTSPTDQATIRTHRETVLAAAAPQGFFTGRPISYTYSDTDGAGANSDSTTGGHANGAVQAAYRQQFAHPTLPLADCGARSWVIGRVRFIQTDETALATAKANTDNSSKTKLGTTQKTWFKAEIDAAAAAKQLVVWMGDGPWIETTSLTGNSWRAYNTERAELGTYIAASGVKLIRLHGDTHTLFYDDGTNNPWGAFPTASAAPLHTTAQPFGQTVSGGKWPTATTNSARQYGIATVTDNGTQISITLKGYSSTIAEPTEVERFTGTITYTPVTPPDPPPATTRLNRRVLTNGYGRAGLTTRTLNRTGYGR